MADDPTLAEQQELLEHWDAGSFNDVRQSLIYHHGKHGGGLRLWEYVRRSLRFDRAKAVRIPPTGTRADGSVKWKQPRNEFLVEKDGKILSYESE